MSASSSHARSGKRVSAQGRGHGSGITVAANDFAHDWTMRDGRATRLVGYASRVEALKALGLEE